MKMIVKEEEIVYITINFDKLYHEFHKNQRVNSYYGGNRDFANESIIKEDKYFKYNRPNRWSYHTQDIKYLTPDELTKEKGLRDFLENIKEKQVTINSDDKIYFSKASSYPRHRLTNFTENKRTISKDKADWVILPNTGFVIESTPEDLFIDINTKQYVKIEGDERRLPSNGTLVDYLFKNYADFSYSNKSLSDFLVLYVKKHLPYTLVPVQLYRMLTDISFGKNEDLLDIYDNYYDKTITEKQLDDYINSKDTTTPLDEERFKTINSLLQSKDESSVGLGLRMMTGIDSNESFIPLSLLFLFNIHNMYRNKEFNTVGVKAIRNKIPFITSYTVVGINSQIQILNRLTKDFVKTEKDRETIRKFGMPMIKGVVDNFINTHLSGIEFVNKYEVILE